MTDESEDSVREHVVTAIQDAISSGQPLKLIREKLKEWGVRFSYSSTPPGEKECERRMRQHNLCANGCGRYANWRINSICVDCRADMWR